MDADAYAPVMAGPVVRKIGEIMTRNFVGIGILCFLLFLIVGCGNNGTATDSTPVITNVSPQNAPVGAIVTITGTNFSTSTADNSVKFNGTTATVSSCTSTQIITTVPAGAISGTITVTVGGKSASHSNFIVNQQYAYVANFGSYAFSAYTINPITGAFTELSGSPINTGSSSVSITADPAGKFVYLANFGSTGVAGGSISAYSINPLNGALTEINGSPFETGTNPISMVVSPSGNFLYVVNQGSSSISAFSINETTGALTEISGSPFATWSNPHSIAIDPTGKFACSANHANYISVYSINASSGALTEVNGSPFITDAYTQSVTFDPTVKFVYLTNFNSAIFAYTINTATGALTEISGSPFATKSTGFSIAIEPAGKFAYALNYSAGNISAYSINTSTGALTEISDSPFATGLFPYSITIDPTGKFAYATNFISKNISVYTINSETGALTEISGSPFADSGGPASLITVKK